MDEMRAMKAIYVYSNHNLCEHIQSAGDNRQALRSAPSVPLARSSGQRKRSSLVALGPCEVNLIFKDVTSDGMIVTHM